MLTIRMNWAFVSGGYVRNYGLGIDSAKSRYSLSYLQAVCAQAGVVVGETPQDSDVNAVDGKIEFAEADVRVQLKCSSTKTMRGSYERIDLEQHWIERWDKCLVPVYVVLVVVPVDQGTWVDYTAAETLHRTRAYWARYDKTSTARSIRIPKTQRFDLPCIDQWHADMLATFDGSAL